MIRYDKPSGELFVTDHVLRGGEPRVRERPEDAARGEAKRLAVNDTISIAGVPVRDSIERGRERQTSRRPGGGGDGDGGDEARARRRGGGGDGDGGDEARARRRGGGGEDDDDRGEAGAAYAFKIGQRVEVTSYEEGYRGSWFDCVVLDLAECKGVALVYMEYKDMQATEDEKDGMLKEWIPISATHAKKKGAKKAADAASGKKAPPGPRRRRRGKRSRRRSRWRR